MLLPIDQFVSFLPPAMKLREGNVFTSVCQEFCPWGGHAWLGEVHDRRACMAGGVHGRGHVWHGGIHGQGYA